MYVTPASKALPYGRPLEGKGLCKIGNPGAPRTTPFSELEVGQNAPAVGSAGVSFAGGKKGRSGAGVRGTSTPMAPCWSRRMDKSYVSSPEK